VRLGSEIMRYEVREVHRCMCEVLNPQRVLITFPAASRGTQILQAKERLLRQGAPSVPTIVAQDEAHDGRLPTPTLPHQRNSLARGDGEVEVPASLRGVFRGWSPCTS